MMPMMPGIERSCSAPKLEYVGSPVTLVEPPKPHEKCVRDAVQAFPIGSTVTALAQVTPDHPYEHDVQYIVLESLNYGRTGLVLVVQSESSYTPYEQCRFNDGKPLVAKIMWHDLPKPQNLASIARAEREIEILLKAQGHKGIIRLMDAFLIERYSVLIMPQIRTTLLSFLRSFERLPHDICAIYAKQLLETLQHLHGLSIVHGDIKPGNLLVQEDNTLVVIDFGSSCIKKQITEGSGSYTGSLAYAPPEFLDDILSNTTLPLSIREPLLSFELNEYVPKSVDTSLASGVDIWATGITIFEALSGWTPLNLLQDFFSSGNTSEKNWEQIFRLALNTDFLRVLLTTAQNAGLLRGPACDFISQCLQQSPENRDKALDVLLQHSFVRDCEIGKYDLSESVKLARRNFLPPGLVHGVPPNEKPRAYVPLAKIVIRQAYDIFTSSTDAEEEGRSSAFLHVFMGLKQVLLNTFTARETPNTRRDSDEESIESSERNDVETTNMDEDEEEEEEEDDERSQYDEMILTSARRPWLTPNAQIEK